MFILDVVPLAKLPAQAPQVLSYFTSEELKPGAEVLIPMQGRKINAIVKDIHQVEQKKMELKRKNFKLKGINEIISPSPLIPEPQLKLASWIQDYFLTSFGAALRLFIPQSLRDRKTPIEDRFNSVSVEKGDNSPTLLWRKDRLDYYKRQIKEEEGQVIFLVPEISDVEQRLDFLKEHFPEEKIAVYHSRLNTTEQFNSWKKARTGKAKIVLGTRSAIFNSCANLSLIIVDKEENPSYKSWDQHPRYQTKEIAKRLTELTSSKLLLGSTMPSVNTYYRAQNEYELKKKELQQVEIEVSDLKEEEEEGYCLLGGKLTDKLEKRLEQGKKSVLFMNRRGLATSVICQDCGQTVECESCEVPTVYHKQQGGYLLCHHCGAKNEDITACPNCGGHRLKYFGAGTQKVAQKVRESFPDANILRLDSDAAPDLEKQREVLKKFKKEGDILVGTKLLLKVKLPDNLFTGIVLIDPILSLPEFNAQEQVFRMIAGFRGCSEQLLIQTYNSDHELFGYLNKSPEEFYKKELKNRKNLWYPPYSEIIKLSYKGSEDSKTKKEAQRVKEKIEKRIKDQKVQVLGPAPNYVPKVENKYIWNLIVKTEPENQKAKQKLRTLIPKDWQVDVNPIQVL